MAEVLADMETPAARQTAPREPVPGIPEGGIDRIDVLEKNLTRQIEAIRASDAKINFLFPTVTAMLGFVVAGVARAAPGTPVALYALIGIVPLVFAYVFLALTAIPRLSSDSRSRLFSGGISRQSVDGYAVEMGRLTPADYVADLARDCHATAGIALSKYRYVRSAYLSFFVSLPFWATSIYLLNRP